MISITTRGKNVIVNIEFCFPANGYSQKFSIEESHIVNAELIADNLRNNLERHIEDLRKEEYHRGWSDAKSKRAKSTLFSCVF
jgi:hypothetical protein